MGEAAGLIEQEFNIIHISHDATGEFSIQIVVGGMHNIRRIITRQHLFYLRQICCQWLNAMGLIGRVTGHTIR